MNDRRSLLLALGSLAALNPLTQVAQGGVAGEATRQRAARADADSPALSAASARANAAHEQLSAAPDLRMHGTEQIAMLLYPQFTALDLVGPYFFFSGLMGARVHLVTNQGTLAPVASDQGLAITPTIRVADCPERLDVLFTPGGSSGTIEAMRDPATRKFMATRGARAGLVTSVCTGSLLLAASGLLRGKRATSHWAMRDLLKDFGAQPVNQRVVIDGNVITGAGVSAGLDFAVTIVERLRGRGYAQMMMLAAEYAPQPPIPGGTVESSPAAIADPMREMFSALAQQVKQIAANG